MNRIIALLFISFFVFSSGAYAEEPTRRTDAFSDMRKPFFPDKSKEETERIKHLGDVTGLEWLQLSLGERTDQVLASMYFLESHGVTLAKFPNDYFNIINERLRADPGLYDTNVTDILAIIVYTKEPETRQAIDRLPR